MPVLTQLWRQCKKVPTIIWPNRSRMDEMLALVQKALEKRALRKEVIELRKQVSSKTGVTTILGKSLKIQLLRESIAQVAQLDCNVLIQGETGTGKELVARTIHELSPRSDHRFVAFNCGAFTEELITSELFGHEKGAFTGASQIKKGLLELAEGGTVFFDEVGELSLPMQVKLLRVLQERTLMRVGGTEEIPVDIRILAATNKDLKKEAENGAFRLDLFYRLDVLTIKVPSLAERKEDIPILVNHFLAKHSPPSSTVPKLSPEVAQQLKQYEYPGNVRELENIAQRLLVQCDGEVIESVHLARRSSEQFSDPSRVAVHSWPSLEEHEKNYILEVLDETEGNKSKAAKILDIDRVSLWRKIKRYGLDDPRQLRVPMQCGIHHSSCNHAVSPVHLQRQAARSTRGITSSAFSTSTTSMLVQHIGVAIFPPPPYWPAAKEQF